MKRNRAKAEAARSGDGSRGGALWQTAPGFRRGLRPVSTNGWTSGRGSCPAPRAAVGSGVTPRSELDRRFDSQPTGGADGGTFGTLSYRPLSLHDLATRAPIVLGRV
jgi:hypothetical protein